MHELALLTLHADTKLCINVTSYASILSYGVTAM